MAWGEPRTTRDVDLSLLTGFENENAVITELLSRFVGRVSDPLNFALRARVVLLVDQSGVGIDVGLSGFPYEEAAIERSRDVEYADGVQLRVVGPEDLVIMKSFAGRFQDWADVEGILRVRGRRLDWNLIDRSVAEFAEITENMEMISTLRRLRDEMPS